MWVLTALPPCPEHRRLPVRVGEGVALVARPDPSLRPSCFAASPTSPPPLRRSSRRPKSTQDRRKTVCQASVGDIIAPSAPQSPSSLEGLRWLHRLARTSSTPHTRLSLSSSCSPAHRLSPTNYVECKTQQQASKLPVRLPPGGCLRLRLARPRCAHQPSMPPCSPLGPRDPHGRR